MIRQRFFSKTSNRRGFSTKVCKIPFGRRVQTLRETRRLTPADVEERAGQQTGWLLEKEWTTSFRTGTTLPVVRLGKPDRSISNTQNQSLAA
jgi:hypothetical protein